LALAPFRPYLCGMEQQQIKAFIDAMAASDLAEMEFSRDGWTLRLVRRGSVPAAAAAVARPAAPRPTVASSPVAVEAAAPASKEFTAPLYGVVHLQPSPGEPPFVVAGQSIAAGQTLCVIEAMKVFNEVRAEHDVVIAAVLVASGDEVEAGQPLLRFA
jgi:acetyl-CoA carboxylase biotin carboxyl carrier protein